ncbi:MAG: hypothetical protein NT026_02740 [Candidatus Staskawiczbacteria bacterium]|nr:hypothetical protein [Candidatus Staskawiczbacteria bacterium]
MPVLKVYGMPSSFAQETLGDLIDSLQIASGSVLGLSTGEISVFFPADLVQRGLGEELVCFVDGLFEKPERTRSLRRTLASAIVSKLSMFVLEYLPQCGKVEAIINRFNQDADGFAVWERRSG